MKKQQLISVVIVNWNGEKWLPNCLASLKEQTYKNFEVIIVDNNSLDKSRTFISDNYPEYKLILNAENVGFAKGNNIGIKASKGEYIILLNNDTVVEIDYIGKFKEAFDHIPHLGIAQSKILWMKQPQLLDGCGSFWTWTTFLYHYGYRKKATLADYSRSFPIFSAKGASMIVKKEVLEKIGMLDDKFWCYYEETDLCHRAWLAGYECWYYPEAVIFHSAGESSTRFEDAYIQYHSYKNHLRSYIKNFSAISLLSILPIYFITLILISLYYIITFKFSYLNSIIKSVCWNVLELSNTLQERNKVQHTRKRSDKQILNIVMLNPDLSYYYHLLVGTVIKYKDTVKP